MVDISEYLAATTVLGVVRVRVVSTDLSFLTCTIYEPANGVPKMPTASSAQMSRKAIRIAK